MTAPNEPTMGAAVCGGDGFLLRQEAGGVRLACPAYPGCGCWTNGKGGSTVNDSTKHPDRQPPRPAYSGKRLHPVDAEQTTEPPVRVQLRRAAGWRMPPNTVKVDRTTKWGNPFVVGKSGGVYSAKVMNRRHAWQLYRSIASDIPDLVRDARAELRGKNLACWCPHDDPYEDCCHAAVLLEIANAS